MTQEQMDTILTMLQAAYPKSLSKDPTTLLVWYGALGHLDYDLVFKAGQSMIRRCQWPSISEIWKSITTDSLPTKAEIKSQLTSQIGQQIINTNDMHYIAKKIWNILGGYSGISGMTDTSWDIAFEREYKEAYGDWFERASTPEGIFLLEGQRREQLK